MSLKSYEKFIDTTIKDAQSKFSTAIQSYINLVIGRANGPTEEFINPVQAQNTANDLLEQAGYTAATLEFLNNDYGRAVNQSSDLLKSRFGGTYRFSDDSLLILDSIKNTDLLQFNQISQDLANRIGRAFSDLSRGLLDKDTFIAQVTQQSELVDNRYIKTQVDTAFSGFNREANQRLATDAGFTEFRYVGPLDSITRDFCRNVLEGKYGEPVKTLDEWNELNDVPERKGQPNPVSVFQGGYNCRHNLVAVR